MVINENPEYGFARLTIGFYSGHHHKVTQDFVAFRGPVCSLYYWSTSAID